MTTGEFLEEGIFMGHAVGFNVYLSAALKLFMTKKEYGDYDLHFLDVPKRLFLIKFKKVPKVDAFKIVNKKSLFRNSNNIYFGTVGFRGKLNFVSTSEPDTFILFPETSRDKLDTLIKIQGYIKDGIFSNVKTHA